MTNDEFFTLVCGFFNVPATRWRLDMFNIWASHESSGVLLEKAFNPLATTQDNHKVAIGNWNSVGVKIFANAFDGAQSTYETIINGYYPAIVRMIDVQEVTVGDMELRSNFTTWVGDDHYGATVISRVAALTSSRGDSVVTTQFVINDIVKVLNSQKLLEWLRDGDELLTGYEIEQEKLALLTKKVEAIEAKLDRIDKFIDFLTSFQS